MADHTHEVISNQIFEDYRKEVKKVHDAIKLLTRQGYTVIDLEGDVITKWNIGESKKKNINYNRAPKLPQTE